MVRGYRHAREGGTSIRLTTDAEGRRILAGGTGDLEAGSYAWARGRLLALQGALALIQLAPLWALGWALVAGIRRLRGHALAPGEVALHAWPAAAGLAFMATPIVLLQVVGAALDPADALAEADQRAGRGLDRLTG